MFENTIKKIVTFQSKSLLCFISFIESIFFPIPTDVLLIPMCFTRSHDWAKLAFLTTIFSVFGGIVGYLLGALIFSDIYPYIVSMNYVREFEGVRELFMKHGALIILISSFTPLPYKVFTIAAGFLSIDLALFIFFSIIGRGLRFYLVAFVTMRHGTMLLNLINRYFLYIAFFIIIIYLLTMLYE